MLARSTIVALWLLCMTSACPALATSPSDQPVLDPGSLRVMAAGGAVYLDTDWTWGLEASLRVGVAPGVELAAPIALGVRIIDAGPGSGIFAGIGIVDLWVNSDKRVLLCPAVILAGQARMGAHSSLRAGVDITGAEEGFDKGDHQAWIRGSLAAVVNAGPWVTLAAGFAFQRRLLGGEPPNGIKRTGWVGDARFSIGSVRAQPFNEIPAISIHVAPFLDIILLFRLDIDTDVNTTDSRWLVGLELFR